MVSAAVGRLGTWGVHLRYPFPLARCIWFTIRATFKRKKEERSKPRNSSIERFRERTRNLETAVRKSYKVVAFSTGKDVALLEVRQTRLTSHKAGIYYILIPHYPTFGVQMVLNICR